MTDQPQEETPLPSFEEFVKNNPVHDVSGLQDVADEVAQVVAVPTVNTTVPPSVILDAQGVPHVVIPLTKSTKAYIGTGLAFVSILGTGSALEFLPDSVKLWAAGAAAVAGVIATFLGIHLPTNLPKRSDKV